jgi:hypothetical protein
MVTDPVLVAGVHRSWGEERNPVASPPGMVSSDSGAVQLVACRSNNLAGRGRVAPLAVTLA